MMLKHLKLTLLSGLWLLPVQTHAQTTTPSPAPAPVQSAPIITFNPPAPPPPGFSRPFSLSTSTPFANSKFYETSYEFSQDYGRCVANISNSRARAFLDTAPNSADERWQLRRIGQLGRPCLPYGYRLPVIFLRGGVAESLYKHAPQANALHTGGTTNAHVAAFQAAEDARSFARLADDRTFTELANCLVVRAPAPTRSLLLSEAGSGDELAALNKLIASAPGCTEKTRFPTNGARVFIRAYIAESAYRWATFKAA